MYPLLEDMSINTSVMKTDTAGAFSLVLDRFARNDKVPHAAVYTLDGVTARELGYLEIAVVGLAYVGDTLVAMGEWGDVCLFDADGAMTQEKIEPERGPMRNIATIDGQLYACGADQQVFRRSARGPWEEIGPGSEWRGDIPDNHLEMIDGFSSSEIYAAGRAGVVWWFDGQEWTAVSCPTNLSFYAVHCGKDGNVYLSGQGGIVAVGRRDAFEIHSPPEKLPDIWGLAHWSDLLHMSGFARPFVWDGERYGLDGQALSLSDTFYDLHLTDNFMWSFGRKDVMRHDGSEWQRLGRVDVE